MSSNINKEFSLTLCFNATLYFTIISEMIHIKNFSVFQDLLYLISLQYFLSGDMI